MTIIIDYHPGNIGSRKNMVGHLGYPSVTSNTPSEIESVRYIIMSWAGSLDSGMKNLQKLGLVFVLHSPHKAVLISYPTRKELAEIEELSLRWS